MKPLLSNYGDVAQLGEHLNGIQEVGGSRPLVSTYEPSRATSEINTFKIDSLKKKSRENYHRRWRTKPLRSFGSNHVDFGGMMPPESETRINSSTDVG
jgi:hypothetical protein